LGFSFLPVSSTGSAARALPHIALMRRSKCSHTFSGSVQILVVYKPPVVSWWVIQRNRLAILSYLNVHDFTPQPRLV
jgi:hypothetical protein